MRNVYEIISDWRKKADYREANASQYDNLSADLSEAHTYRNCANELEAWARSGLASMSPNLDSDKPEA